MNKTPHTGSYESPVFEFTAVAYDSVLCESIPGSSVEDWIEEEI